MKFSTLKRLWFLSRIKPCVVISDYGQKTDTNHKVSVGFASKKGASGALVFPGTQQGHAQADMYAGHYSRILGIPIHDSRVKPLVFAKDVVPIEISPLTRYRGPTSFDLIDKKVFPHRYEGDWLHRFDPKMRDGYEEEMDATTGEHRHRKIKGADAMGYDWKPGRAPRLDD